MSFPSLAILWATIMALASLGWLFQHWTHSVPFPHPMGRTRATFVVICYLPALLLTTGWESLLSADTADPGQAIPRPPPPVYQKLIQESLTADPKTASVTLQENHGRQELKKSALDRGLDSVSTIQLVDKSGAGAGEVVETSPKKIMNESELDLQSLTTFNSSLTPLPNVDGWQVVVGPYLTIKDCLRELDQTIVVVTNQYITETLGRDDVRRYLRIDADFVRSHLSCEVTEPELVDTSYGEMRCLTAVLRFDHDQSFLDELDARWKNVQREARMLQAGFGSGSILLLLATVFGYRKLDTLTCGCYSERLQLVGAGTILAIFAAGLGISRWIPWI